jgi:hypothetical protein
MPSPAYCLHQTFDPSGPALFQLDRHYLLYALIDTLRLEANGQPWTLDPTRAALIGAGQPVSITILSKLTSASVLFEPGFIAPLP